jgi:hypothetical protein
MVISGALIPVVLAGRRNQRQAMRMKPLYFSKRNG